MSEKSYFASAGGLPGQDQLMTGRAVFTEAYAVIPRGVFSDITASLLPDWTETRAWIIARPLSGFAETFAQYLMEVGPGGGSYHPEPDPDAQAALFFVGGQATLTLDGEAHEMTPGAFAYLPPSARWRLKTTSDEAARFLWVRKKYERVDGLDLPDPIFVHDDDVAPAALPDTDGNWATTRFIDPSDVRYDMHMNIVTFQPGGLIPFEETHVMEHGLYVLQGKGVYKLNRDWVEVEAGDFMWLRAFCPQACYGGGTGPFRYLLYKDVNRHPQL